MVVKEELTLILGLRASEAMNLITVHKENFQEAIIHQIQEEQVSQILLGTREEIMQSFPQAFSEGVGSLPGEQHLEVDPDVKLRVNTVRRVPYSFVNDLKKELNQMEEDKVITKVNTPTPWGSSLVTQKKPTGKLRMCLNPQKLNIALKREHCYKPVLDDILPKLQNAKIFSVLDLKAGYWHVKLDEESSYLTAFNTPFERYRWLRMPFGINPAAEIFQRRLHQALEDLDGIACIAGDIVVIGNGDTEEEARMNHDTKVLAGTTEKM